MNPKPTRLRSRHTVAPGGVMDAVVTISGGRITEVVPADVTDASGAEDLGALWLMPGLTDPHVHVNEPGRAEWEGFATATRAAAAGGITTIIDMPLNSIPATCEVAALAAKRAAARGQCHVDVGFWGGVVPGNARELESMAEAGVLGFKCFLAPSGVAEFAHVGERDLREAMPIVARLGLPLLAHAESPRALEAAASTKGRDVRAYATWLATRPPAAECEAIELLIRLARETGCRVHLVHLSTSEALPMIREARRTKLRLTVETCPHYLCFDAESIPDGATEFKCAPPIRDRANREALWAALREGLIDVIATDHSPCPPAMKQRERGDFMTAWGGIASLECSLSAVWGEARTRGFTAAHVVHWMSAAPARLAGLESTKGAIASGRDADLIAFDPDRAWTVEAPLLEQRHKLTPYLGRAMRGRAVATWLRGRQVAEEGAASGTPEGRLVPELVAGGGARFDRPVGGESRS